MLTTDATADAPREIQKNALPIPRDALSPVATSSFVQLFLMDPRVVSRGLINQFATRGFAGALERASLASDYELVCLIRIG